VHRLIKPKPLVAIVEDDPASQKTLARVLRRGGYEGVAAFPDMHRELFRIRRPTLKRPDIRCPVLSHILTPPWSLTPGTRLGPYEVVSAIGAGGMGEVYCATDTKVKRQDAIKILPASVATDHDRLARFQARQKSSRP